MQGSPGRRARKVAPWQGNPLSRALFDELKNTSGVRYVTVPMELDALVHGVHERGKADVVLPLMAERRCRTQRGRGQPWLGQASAAPLKTLSVVSSHGSALASKDGCPRDPHQ